MTHEAIVIACYKHMLFVQVKPTSSSPEAPLTVGDTEGIGLGLGIVSFTCSFHIIMQTCYFSSAFLMQAPASHKHPVSPATALKKSKTASKTEARHKDSKSRYTLHL